MRLEGRMRLGYFPLHQREAQRMRRFLQFPNEPASALDPCAGTGAALVAITENSCSRRYGIELDSHRALEARTTLDEVIQSRCRAYACIPTDLPTLGRLPFPMT